MKFLIYFHRKVWFSFVFLLTIATHGKANFLMKQGAKLKRKKANPRKYQANLYMLKREEIKDEEEKDAD